MPWRSRKPCRRPGCHELTDDGLCVAHRRERDRQRPSSAERGYDRQWRTFREAYLIRHPVCECSSGCGQPSTDLHHVTRLIDGGDKYDERNLQALSGECHDRLGGAGGRA